MPASRYAIATAAAALIQGQMLPAQTASSPAEQIALAVQAAPQAYRDGATVMGYNAAGALVRLRAGTNSMICLADDPAQENFHVSCYHRSLEPFMARGREIRARNSAVTREQVDSIRLSEIRARRYRVPDRAMLYQLFAPADSVDVPNARLRSPTRLDVVYLPYATAASTGLTTDPVRGGAWLMYPGTPWAHIMMGP